jgi:tetratricopeptide (TPR) repeat protein
LLHIIYKMSLSQEDKKLFGNPIYVDSVPCVIREILYAPPCPDSVAKLLEVALTHHNTSHYQLALQNYITAQENWVEISKESLNIHAIIFFRCAIGSVYQSCGQDEMALAEFMVFVLLEEYTNLRKEGKRYADTLNDDDPDKAIAYSCIGSVYVHLSQFELALEYFLICKDIREKVESVRVEVLMVKVFGPHHVETASVLNNIAVCLQCLNKVSEALELYTSAYKILNAELGLDHPRTVLVSRNIAKAQEKYMQEYNFFLVFLFTLH